MGIEFLTREQAVAFIEGRGNEFFSVRFVRRTKNAKQEAGEIRQINCRLNVTKHLAGGVAAYDFRAKNLIPVWDPHASDGKGGYRSIPLDSVTEISIAGKWIPVVES